MTVQSIDPQVIYDGDAVTRVFPFGFDMAAESSLRVSFVSLGLMETVVPPEDYSVARFGQGGEVTFDLAPPADVKVVLTRQTPLTQQVSVTAQTAYDPRVVESVWDKLTVVSQELAMAQQTMLRGAPGTDPTTIYSVMMQAAESASENAGLAFGARVGAENARDASQTARGLAEGARDAAVTARGGAESARDTALTYRNQAQAAQTAAATSAGNASSSATTASNAAIATAADRVQTGLDKAATAADRAQTGLDKAATAADRQAAESAAALANGMPLGTIMHFAADTPPEGWLVCDGAAATFLYPDLWAYLLGGGATFGNVKNTAGNLLPGVNPAEDLSVWTLSRATADATVITAPDGSSTLWKLAETTSVGEHFADRNVNVTLGQTYYYSALVKPDADRSFELRTALAAGNRGVVVDAAGNVLRREGVGSEMVVRLPNGLIFVQMGVTANATGAGVFRLQSCGPGGARSIAGTAGKGVLVWGMRTATDAVPHVYPRLPDLRGEFVRGWDSGRGVDAGRVFGSAQEDDLKAHQHVVYVSGSPGSRSDAFDVDDQNSGTNPAEKPTSEVGGDETRPRNVALLPCIRAYASVVDSQGKAVLNTDLETIYNASLRKNTLDATRAPLPTDDASQGYAPGSRWLWQGQEWVAVGVDAGAARWISTLQVTPQMFGAVGDGVADDTAAVQAWADAGGGVANGSYRLTAPVTIADKPLVIRGSGEGRRASFVVAGAVGFSLTRTGAGIAAGAFADLSGVDFWPVGAGVATAIRLEETRPSTGIHVCGGVDFLRMHGVMFRSDATNYWRAGLHTINAGGVVGSDVEFGDQSSHSAQADTLARHVRIENTQANVFVIRALQLTNIYLRRAYKHIEVSAENSVESIYLSTGELVGAQRVIEFNGPGVVGAIMLAGLHMDTLGEAVWVDSATAVAIARIVGCDLRKGNNGGAYAGGALVRVARGESLTISATQFSGTSARTPPGPAHPGVTIEGGFTRAVVDGGNMFRNMDTGVVVAGIANRIAVGPFHHHNVTNPTDVTSADATNVISPAMGDYDGALDNLAGTPRGVSTQRIAPGASGFPPFAGGAGGIIRTTVFDQSAAYQELLSANNPSIMFVRRKAGGVWGGWSRIQTFPASGPQDLTGTGSPESVVAAPVGSTYRRTDGGAGTTLYVKESGSGSTGWVAK